MNDRYVYVWTNLANGKRYVGKGAGRRYIQHMYLRGGCPLLKAAVQKYGRGMFWLAFVGVDLTDKAACQLEKETIFWLNTKSPHGYNITDGGEGVSGVKRSLEARRKQSERQSTPEALERNRAHMEEMRRLGRLKVCEPAIPRHLWPTIGMLKVCGADYGSLTENLGYGRSSFETVVKKIGLTGKIALSLSRGPQVNVRKDRKIKPGSAEETNILILKSLGARYVDLGPWFGVHYATINYLCVKNGFRRVVGTRGWAVHENA